MEMDETMWWSIPQSERNDHLRASFNPLWSKPVTMACLWCIPSGYWGSVAPRDEWWYWATHNFYFKDTHKNWAKVRTDWERSLLNSIGVKNFCVYLFEHSLTLFTDHQPLASISHRGKSIPVVTAARLQHYTLFLAGYGYTIEYRNTKSSE